MGELNNQLWASADILRGKMDASEYKNYLLGLVFYKYLSDQELRAVYEEEHGSVAVYPSREEQFTGLSDWHNDDAEGIRDIVSKRLGYFIEPENLFYTLRKKAGEYELQISDIQNAFLELGKQGEHFTGLFDDVDLTSTKLGSNAQQRNVTITEVIKALDEIDLFGHDGDVIGDAYEYLIGQFAAGAGKKAGEFYTPQAVSKIISEIVSIGQENTVFYGTSIPTVVLILKKNRDKRDVLFIDASNDFEKQKNQNILRNSDIKKIVDAYKKRMNITKYAHLAKYEEIAGNDYNLNIPRYVDTFEEILNPNSRRKM